MANQKIKHIPLRTCVVTREKRPQKELVRIVKTKLNDVEMLKIDSGKKLDGRGVYLVPDLEVFDKAFKNKRNPIKYALKMDRGLTGEEIEVMREEFIKAISKKNNGDMKFV